MNLTYILCKKKIERNQYETVEKMHEMLDVFYAGERLNTDEYQELTILLEAQ